jgi:hypothetical protein
MPSPYIVEPKPATAMANALGSPDYHPDTTIMLAIAWGSFPPP